MNVNVYLKKIKMPLKDFIQLILNGNSKEIGIDNLYCLRKILPEPSEIDEIKYFFETNPINIEDLAISKKAEYFIKKLIDISYFRLRIDAMIYLEEFSEVYSNLQQKFDIYFQASNQILTNDSLKNFIRLVLLAGNFLNNVSNLKLKQVSYNFGLS